MNIVIPVKDISRIASKTLLEVVEQMGVPINSSCRAGMCGMCKCKSKDTKALKSSSTMQPLRPLAEGEFLPCVSLIDTSANDLPPSINIQLLT